MWEKFSFPLFHDWKSIWRYGNLWRVLFQRTQLLKNYRKHIFRLLSPYMWRLLKTQVRWNWCCFKHTKWKGLCYALLISTLSLGFRKVVQYWGQNVLYFGYECRRFSEKVSRGTFLIENVNISKKEGLRSLFSGNVPFPTDCSAVLGFAWKLQHGKCPKNGDLEACFRKTKHANNQWDNKECEEGDKGGWI